MKEKEITFGQNVYEEGDQDDSIYFIINGEFEMTKDIYIIQEDNKLGFRRMVIDDQQLHLDKFINENTQVFVTNNENELSRLKSKYKNAYKNTTRMCLLGK